MNLDDMLAQQSKLFNEALAKLLSTRKSGNSTDTVDSISDHSVNDPDTVNVDDLRNRCDFMEEQRSLVSQFWTGNVRRQSEVAVPHSSSHQRQENSDSNRRRTETNFTCPVCMESLSSVKTRYDTMDTECGHVFCQPCIENVCGTGTQNPRGLGSGALCPICRKRVGELRKVYF